jgi:hypothetical protein
MQPNAKTERRPTGTVPGIATKPALWAVRSSAKLGVILGMRMRRLLFVNPACDLFRHSV